MAETVDKLTAAERLIVAGIAMLGRGDDPFATQVVGASALNMLRELIQQGGENYSERVMKEGLFYVATTRLNGDEVAIPTSPEMDAIVEKVIEGINAGHVEKPSDLILDLDAEGLRKLLDYITRPFNFLKHAQRDPLATLDEGDVDPKGAIIHALTALKMLDPGRDMPEQIAPFLKENDLM